MGIIILSTLTSSVEVSLWPDFCSWAAHYSTFHQGSPGAGVWLSSHQLRCLHPRLDDRAAGPSSFSHCPFVCSLGGYRWWSDSWNSHSNRKTETEFVALGFSLAILRYCMHFGSLLVGWVFSAWCFTFFSLCPPPTKWLHVEIRLKANVRFWMSPCLPSLLSSTLLLNVVNADCTVPATEVPCDTIWFLPCSHSIYHHLHRHSLHKIYTHFYNSWCISAVPRPPSCLCHHINDVNRWHCTMGQMLFCFTFHDSFNSHNNSTEQILLLQVCTEEPRWGHWCIRAVKIL